MLAYWLRDAEMKDLEFILKLRRMTLKPFIEQIWGWDEKYQTEEFQHNFAPERNQIIVFQGNDIGVLELLEDHHKMNIIELEILPEYQGKGIGSDILRNILAAGESKKKSVNVGCFKNNEYAMQLYCYLGFKYSSETPTHILLEKKQR